MKFISQLTLSKDCGKKFSKVMRLTAVFIFFAIISAHGKGYSQKVTLSVKDIKLEKVFKEIKKQTGFVFFYDETSIKQAQKINLNVSGVSMQEALNLCFKELNFTYTIIGNTVVVKQKPPAVINVASPILLSEIEIAPIVINGVILDENGKPLQGASVVIKATGKGMATDIAGSFKLQVQDLSATIVVSYIGYETVEIKLKNTDKLSIKLKRIDAKGEELVVVGYGTQKKVNLTGAVGVASGERLENRAISTVGEGLQGVIPNLNVTVRNGDPTANVALNVRGYGSINGSEPLVLVDGVPMDINKINPNDIKSISVLKDAAAGAVYGSRAAFGVVLVETKKGQVDKLKVSFNSQLSLSKSIFNTDPETDPYQFVLAKNAAVIRSGTAPLYDADMIAGTKAYSENPTTAPQWKVLAGSLRFYGSNNYQNDVLSEYSPTNQKDLSVSGGTDKAKFYASFGYLSKDGYLKIGNDQFKRTNLLLRSDFKINNWLSLDEKVVFNSQYSNKAHIYSTDVSVNTISRVDAFQPLVFPDLEYYIAPGDHDKYAPYIGRYFTGLNALPYLQDGGRTTFTNNDLWLTQGITLTPFKGFKLRADYSFNSYERVYQDVANKVESINTALSGPMITYGYSADDFITNTNTHNNYSVLNAYAEYAVPSLGNHSLTSMVGYNQEYGYYSFVSATNRGLITPGIADIGATIGSQQATGSKAEVALQGVFYRVLYDFKKKYLLEINGRYDGSSRFPKASRYGFFPSISGAWRISNEKFMSRTKSWIDNLKVRASYGTLGNQLLGSNYYPYIPTMGVSLGQIIYTSGAVPIVTPAGLVSPSLTWETVTSQNIGLDFTLFKGRFDVSLDAYIRDTKNMLLNVSYPAILGTTAPKENGADLRTKGWEATVSWKDVIKKNWSYGIALALSDNQTTITKYNNPTGNYSNYYVGKNIGEIWGYETVGIFQADADVASAPTQAGIGTGWKAGDIQYKDLNGDGKIDGGGATLSNPGDKKIIGNSSPRYTFGINTSVGFKNFKLSVFFQGVGKVDYMPSDTRWNWFYPFQSGYVEKYYTTESWSTTNRDAYFPAPDYLATKNIAPQTRFIQNAAYIRLKNISLSYNLPEKLIKKWGLDKMELYASGMNLWEYSKIHKPLDPETIQTGLIEFPMQRIITFGLNISF